MSKNICTDLIECDSEKIVIACNKIIDEVTRERNIMIAEHEEWLNSEIDKRMKRRWFRPKNREAAKKSILYNMSWEQQFDWISHTYHREIIFNKASELLKACDVALSSTILLSTETASLINKYVASEH